MQNKNNIHFIGLENGVRQICNNFLSARALTYFHFRRTFQDGSSIIMTTNIEAVADFLRNHAHKIPSFTPLPIHQSWVYFWDECLPQNQIISTQRRDGIYHGMTILNRHKEYYDCAAFAMGKPHPSPSSYYLNIFHDLKAFAEIFPKMSTQFPEKMNPQSMCSEGISQDLSHKLFFLPQRSKRIFLGESTKHYATTYEILCMKLLREGRSYSEIGSILSMSARSVETHLTRLKARTNLSTTNLLTKAFQLRLIGTSPVSGY